MLAPKHTKKMTAELTEENQSTITMFLPKYEAYLTAWDKWNNKIQFHLVMK